MVNSQSVTLFLFFIYLVCSVESRAKNRHHEGMEKSALVINGKKSVTNNEAEHVDPEKSEDDQEREDQVRFEKLHYNYFILLYNNYFLHTNSSGFEVQHPWKLYYLKQLILLERKFVLPLLPWVWCSVLGARVRRIKRNWLVKHWDTKNGSISDNFNSTTES